MIRIGIVGDIGSGKSFIAKKFGYPVFNADEEVGKLYKKNKKIFIKLKKILPKYIHTFPISKNEITNAILSNKINLQKIIKIVHLEIRKKMYLFIQKNKNKKIIILDIPLFLENKLNKKDDIIIFIQSPQVKIDKNLKKRINYNKKLINKLKLVQWPLKRKKKISNLIIKNNFQRKDALKSVNNILRKIV